MDSLPHLQQYLGTNYVPLVDEMRQIKEFLEASDKEICDIDIEIDLLRRQLDLLEQKRLKMHGLAEQHRALVSPARRLNRDILEEIFLACLPADRNPCMSVTDAPLLLTRVCSSWRSIAHSTPRLWAAIHIVLPLYRAMQYPSPGSISHIEETVCLRMDNITASAKQWLDRSGACPLSISIYQGQEWESNSSDFEDLMKKVRRLQITFIIDVVVPYHQRWYDLDVCLPADALYNLLNINVLKTECLKALQKLHVTRQFSATQGSRVTKGLTDILCFFTSHVTAATFWGITIYPSDIPSISKHALGQLTELNLELSYNSGSYVNPVDFATVIIGQCQFLKILKLNMLSNYMFGDGPGTGSPGVGKGNISLPHLTTLSLIVWSSPEVANFVKRLHLPSLEELYFSGHHAGGHVQTAGSGILTTLLHVCGQNLHSLELYSPLSPELASARDLVELLRLTPLLKRFIISASLLSHHRWVSALMSISSLQCYPEIINDELLLALSPPEKNHSEMICPQLEVLECDYHLVTGITEQGLKAFLKARNHAHIRDQGNVAALRQLILSINELKQEEEQKTEKLTLSGGNPPAIYFRRPNDSFSPWDGLEHDHGGQMQFVYEYFIRHDIYN